MKFETFKCRKGRVRRYFAKLSASITDPLVKINYKALSDVEKKHFDESDVSYYNRLQDSAKNGPIFSAQILSSIENIPQALLPNSKKPFVIWLGNRLKANDAHLQDEVSVIDSSLWTTIRDFINSKGWQNFDSFDTLCQKAQDWQDELAEADDKSGGITGDPVVYQFEDGHAIVQVKPENLNAEGCSMGHCIGSYYDVVKSKKTKIFSLRNNKGKPLTTIEISQNNNIVEIKGRGNKTVSPKYRKYIIEWVESLGKDVDVASTDYVNLLPDDKFTDFVLNNTHKIGTADDFVLNRKSEDPRYVELLKDLAREQKGLLFVVGNVNTPGYMLEQIIEEAENTANDLTLIRALSNSNTPVHLLKKFSNSRRPLFREAVALNPNLPTDLIKKLSNDVETNVVLAIAIRSDLPTDVVRTLSKHTDSGVAERIAYNKNLPPDVIDNLLLHEGDNVLKALALRKDLSEQDIYSIYEKTKGFSFYSFAKEALSRNPSTPAKLLMQLANEAPQFRFYVSQNPSSTSEVLDSLIAIPNLAESVAAGVAKHPNVSPDTLKTLLINNTSKYIIQEALKSPSMNDEVWNVIIKVNDDSVTRTIASELITSKVSAPYFVYDALSAHTNAIIRMFIAANETTPSQVLENIAKTDIPTVRDIANQTLSKRRQAK
jgi:hypothetical protein